ncbi:MAG: hypothetical protein JW881_21185 [Spirochaetales bacterium]|nr:hypothetical protein [Spirochaetales bacterium]
MKKTVIFVFTVLLLQSLFPDEKSADEGRLVLLYQVTGWFTTDVPGDFETREKGFFYYDPQTCVTSAIQLDKRETLKYSWIDVFISDNSKYMALVYVRAGEGDQHPGHIIEIADENGRIQTFGIPYNVSDINNNGDILLYDWTAKRTHTDVYILNYDTKQVAKYYELDFGGYGKAEDFMFDNSAECVYFYAGDNRLGILDGKSISYRSLKNELRMVDINFDKLVTMHVSIEEGRFTGSFHILNKSTFEEQIQGSGFVARLNNQDGYIVYDDGVMGGNLHFLKDGDDSLIYDKSTYNIPAFPFGWVRSDVLKAYMK